MASEMVLNCPWPRRDTRIGCGAFGMVGFEVAAFGCLRLGALTVRFGADLVAAFLAALGFDLMDAMVSLPCSARHRGLKPQTMDAANRPANEDALFICP